jgi:hypothetical protein
MANLIHSDILAVVNLLQVEDDLVDEFRKRVNAIEKVEDAQTLIKELRECVKTAATLRKLEDVPYYLILLSCCHIPINDLDEAAQIAENAIVKARLCKLDWLEAMACWFVSLIYRESDKVLRYRAELDQARSLTKKILDEHRIKGQYDKAAYCEAVVQKIEEEYAYATNEANKGVAPSESESGEGSRSRRNQDSDYLTAPWLPVYKSVQAGLSGVTWVEEIGQTIGISQIVIGEQRLNLFNLRKTAQTDRQIRLKPGERAGFVKVIGNSMNACAPTPIEANDYVLFYKASQANDNDIVIASQPSPSGEPAYIVKRYSETDKTLISETNDTSQSYPPIKIGRQHQILGIVIAVAKPEQG